MPDLVNTAAHRAARNAASIALADTGAGVASIKLYSASSGGTLLAVRNLAKPCGTVTGAGRIELAQATADDLVLADGGAAWGEWCDADGVAISAGHVTDENGDYTSAGVTGPHPSGVGAFVLSGGAAGTQLYAGGIVRLTTALIG